VAEAAKNLNDEQARLQATQARDAYVKDVESQLAALQTNIDQMQTQADDAADAEQEAINARIEALQAQHDRTEEALDNLKGADLATWETHKEEVRSAMQGGDAVR